MVVFTCFGPKKEPFVAQPSLTEWQDWTNRGWRAVSSYTAYVLIALSCDQFLLHVSLSKSTGEELVAFLLHALLWWYSLAARERWPYGGMKNADMTDREMRNEKTLVKYAFPGFGLRRHLGSTVSYHSSPSFYPCLPCFDHCKGFGEPVLMHEHRQIS